MERLDVLAVIRAPLEQYPPSTNQVALLAEHGLAVGVADLSHQDYRSFNFNGQHEVQRFQSGRHVQLHNEKVPNLFVRLLRAWSFRRCVNQIIKRCRPKVVIAYDPNAIWAVAPLCEQTEPPRLIWHFHELSLPAALSNRILRPGAFAPDGNATRKLTPSTPQSNRTNMSAGRLRDCFAAGSLTAGAVKFACANAQCADLIVFPDQDRADIFDRVLTLPKFPRMVMNCPRLRSSVPENRLAERLEELGFKDAKTVYFHGWIGPTRCIEAVIESIKLWPAAALFILVGPVAHDYRNALERLACDVGVARRVVFLASVPYRDICSLAVGAAIGMSLVSDQSDLNWTYSAGAINKRFEYMSVGLPQIANTGPGMHEIIEQPECGILVNPKSPEEIGLAVRHLLLDENCRRSMGTNARNAHLGTFNYEHQFESVQKVILEWCEEENNCLTGK